MFGLFKKKHAIAAPVTGEVIPITQVNDEAFSTEVLGKGVGIIPDDSGKIVAPCDGKLEMVFSTGHAVSMVCDNGVELLIHVGIDTVKLDGEHFKVCCAAGDTVKTGDLLLEFDKTAIVSKGYDPTVMVVVCNTDTYKDILCETGNKTAGAPLLQIVV